MGKECHDMMKVLYQTVNWTVTSVYCYTASLHSHWIIELLPAYFNNFACHVCPCLPVSVWLSVWGCYRLARVRDAVPLLHRPAVCPAAALLPPHPAAVHPQRDQHSEIHQVRRLMSGVHACIKFVRLFVMAVQMQLVFLSGSSFWIVCTV